MSKKQAWMLNKDIAYVWPTRLWSKVQTTGRCKRIKGDLNTPENEEKIQYEIKQPTFWNKNKCIWVDSCTIIFRDEMVEEIFKCSQENK
jgi:hypothetical protein